jgi:hypothetical protein
MCPPTDGSIDRSVGRLVAWLLGCLVAWLLASCCRALAFADTPRRDYTHWIPQITTIFFLPSFFFPEIILFFISSLVVVVVALSSVSCDFFSPMLSLSYV